MLQGIDKNRLIMYRLYLSYSVVELISSIFFKAGVSHHLDAYVFLSTSMKVYKQILQYIVWEKCFYLFEQLKN